MAVLALFVISAPAAQAGPKSTVYSSPSVQLVDDDGVTRSFFVSYNFNPSSGVTTCNYSVWGNETPNPNDGNLPIPEGYVQDAGTTVAPNQSAAIAYCVDRFPDRTRVPNDPTPAV